MSNQFESFEGAQTCTVIILEQIHRPGFYILEFKNIELSRKAETSQNIGRFVEILLSNLVNEYNITRVHLLRCRV